MSWVLLLLVSAVFVLARAGVRRPGRRGPLWLPAMVGGELAPVLLVGLVVVVGAFSATGWANGIAGAAALLVSALAGILLAVSIGRAFRSTQLIGRSLSPPAGAGVPIPRPGPVALLRPYPSLSARFDVETHSYGPHERHVVDRVARRDLPGPAPALVHIHGGGWWRGRRGRQGRPLIRRMVEAGWVVLTPTYRLSPEATFPDHLDDIRRMLAWARSANGALMVDPSFVAVAGGSAGGHLAALAALRQHDPLPDGLDGDATVQAAVPLYGVHDLLDGDVPKWPYLETEVMKSRPGDEPAAWREASPVHGATAARPPFLVVHGAWDTVVPPEDSRRLVVALEAAGGPPVQHLEVRWANHGFDFFASPRGVATAEVIARALEGLYAETRRA